MRKDFYTPTTSWPLALKSPCQEDKTTYRRILLIIASIICLAALVGLTIWNFHILPSYMDNPIKDFPNSQKLWNWINHDQIFVGSCSLTLFFLAFTVNGFVLDKTIEVWTRYRETRNLE